jgi:cytochrome P450
MLVPTLNGKDPLGHTRIRRMVMPEFGPAAVRARPAKMVERGAGDDRLLHRHRGGRGHAEFAGRIPLLVMARLLGFPPEDAIDSAASITPGVGPPGRA